MKYKIILIFIILIAVEANAEIWLPRFFADHMILQRDIEIPVWGKSQPGSEITVTLYNTSVQTKANENGEWNVHLPQMQAGGPFQMTISSNGNDKITINDVLIGDVWLASGQSNMEWRVKEAANAKEEISNANYPKIRFFIVPHKKNYKVENDVSGGEWQICDSTAVKEFSAVAYYFSRKIHQDINVPVGIIQSTWGGSPVEAWTSKEMLLSSEITRDRVLQDEKITKKDFITDSLNLERFWDIVYHTQNNTDKVVPKLKYNDSDWSEVNMPSVIHDWNIYPYEGIVWLRKEIEVDSRFINNDLVINLGHPEMNYSLFINGKKTCHTVWNAEKSHFYHIPKTTLKSGKNIISIRMSVLWGGGGLNPPAKDIYLTNGNDTINLAGSWKLNKDLEPSVPKIVNYQYYPTFLYNTMISPVIPFGLKGFIWYQGEANDSLAYNYRSLFPMMITDWRIRWKQGYLPFLFVQLPNYRERLNQPGESQWAELREAQSMALSLPNTGMVCAIDIGDAKTIHPLDKQSVGKRLALVAEQQVYNKDLIASGPIFLNYRKKGKKIILTFDQNNLITQDKQSPRGFTIAGADHKFYLADAKINGNQIEVWSENVPEPVAVRYAWADNPDCNVFNSSGFPMIPFRTDNWDGITKR